MLYNGVELPNIDTVWTDKETYPYVTIYVWNSTTTFLVLSATKLYINSTAIRVGTSTQWERYSLVDGTWNLIDNNNSIFQSGFSSVTWVNFDVLNSDGAVYLAASDPVNPNAPTGTMEIQSTQVLDDSVSSVISVTGLSSGEAIYTIKSVRYLDGVEVSSGESEAFAGPEISAQVTAANLNPETTYEIKYILCENGEETDVFQSVTFTTLAGSGAGEGETDTPDYTVQLERIEQSVDDVGTKLDGVQDTLTETKEEITSLPEKIATSITEGVKGLFIPSQEDLTAVRDKYEDMLSEKLGFIWQAYDLLTTFIGDLQTNLESGGAYEFNFPGIKLPMQGEEFVLVAETSVSLENDLMDVLRPVLGTIVSIICVTAFVNMAHDYVLAIVSGVSAYEFERRKE